MARRHARLSARVAIERDGLLLCARHRARDGAGTFLCLPGGRVEDGEAVAAAAVREVSEETGAAVALTGVVLVQDLPQRLVEVVFRGTIEAGEPTFTGADEGLVALEWHPAGDLPAEFAPAALADRLRRAGTLAALPAAPCVAWQDS